MSSPTFLDMPDLVMDKILDLVGFYEIFYLRKVCKSLRSYIDEKKPELKNSEFEIFVKISEVSLQFPPGNELKYCNDGTVTLKKSGESEIQKTSKLEDVNQFWADFELFLQFQNSTMESLKIQMVPYAQHDPLEKLSKILGNRLRPLSVKTIYLECKGEEEAKISKMLDFLNPKILKTLTIANVDSEVEDEKFDISKLSKNFKNLEEIGIHGFVVHGNLADFAHFSKADVTFNEIRAEDVGELKKILQSSPNIDRSHLQYLKFEDPQNLPSALGTPNLMHNTRQRTKYCYFETENSEKVLSFNHNYLKKYINFCLMDRFWLDDDMELII